MEKEENPLRHDLRHGPASTPPKRRPRNLKFMRLAIPLLFIGLIAGWLVFARPAPKVESRDLSSKGGKITLHKVYEGMKLQNGTPLSGSARLEKDESSFVYYTVTTTKEKKVVGSGNMSVDAKNNFSRNLTLKTDKAEAEEATLQVFLQDQHGKRLDDVTMKVVLSKGEGGKVSLQIKGTLAKDKYVN